MEVDYSWYKSVFCGTLTEAEFRRYHVKACAYIRRITCGRANDTDAVRMAVCEVAEALAHEERDVVASESNDGISVTYRADNVSTERRLYQAALLHLSGTGLLYRGCYE